MEIKELFDPPADLEDLTESEPAPGSDMVAEINRRKLSIGEALTGLAKWHQYVDSQLRGLEAQYRPLIEAMEADLKMLERKQGYIKRCIELILPPGKESAMTNDAVSLFYSPSHAVEIQDATAIPLEHCEVLDPKPNIRSIKAAIERGEDVPGAKITTRWNLRIKPGGPRAIKNAKLRAKKAELGEGPDWLENP